MEKPRHTFAIIAYKESPYLEECILSLRKQTIQSDIFISTSTPSIFLDRLSEKYRIPIIVNNFNDGIASDWSFAYNNCVTDYVTLAHQDDIYLPEYTEDCLGAAQKEGADNLIIFTDCSNLYKKKIAPFSLNLMIKNILLLAFFFKPCTRYDFIKRGVLFLGNPIACPSVMYHKELIGPFEFSKNFHCNMDWDAWLRLSQRKGGFIYVRKKIILHRIHQNSQTMIQVKKNIRRKEDEIIFRRLWPEPAAKLLAGIYSFASKSNEVKHDKIAETDGK